MVWQCRRTEAEAASLAARSDVAWVQEATGLPIDPYFSATKLAWLLDHVPGARERAARGELAAGTLDTFTLFRLSQGRVFATEPSTACRTLLAELETGRFSRRLCEFFGVPWGLLPEVVASDADLGVVPIGGRALPVRGLLCDQPSALLGVGCVAPGDVKCTYGTGAFLQVHTGERPAPPSKDDGLLRSIAWERNGQRVYLLEGSVLAAGDVLTWLQSLGILGPASGIDALLEAHPDASGVLFAPTLTGLGAPRWVGDARGTLLGLHRGVSPGHLVRAALEGIAHQVVDVLEAASKAFSAELGPLRADGGLSASQRFLALQADLAGRPLLAPHVGEATTRGVGSPRGPRRRPRSLGGIGARGANQRARRAVPLPRAASRAATPPPRAARPRHGPGGPGARARGGPAPPTLTRRSRLSPKSHTPGDRKPSLRTDRAGPHRGKPRRSARPA